MNPNYYGCIAKQKRLTTEEVEKLYLESMANRIEVTELTTHDLTMAEFDQYVKAFISHYHVEQAY